MNRRQRIVVTAVAATGVLGAAGAAAAIATPRPASQTAPSSATSAAEASIRAQLAALDAQSDALRLKASAAVIALANARRAQLLRDLSALEDGQPAVALTPGTPSHVSKGRSSDPSPYPTHVRPSNPTITKDSSKNDGNEQPTVAPAPSTPPPTQATTKASGATSSPAGDDSPESDD